MLSNNTKISDGVILSNAKDPAQGRRCMKALVATTGGLSPQRSLTLNVCEIALTAT